MNCKICGVILHPRNCKANGKKATKCGKCYLRWKRKSREGGGSNESE